MTVAASKKRCPALDISIQVVSPFEDVKISICIFTQHTKQQGLIFSIHLRKAEKQLNYRKTNIRSNP